MTAHDLAQRLNARPSGSGKWVARCPVHDDRLPSLSISEGSRGNTLVHCHAGCPAAAILGAIGLKLRDLFIGAAPVRAISYSKRATHAEIHEALRQEAIAYRRDRRVDGCLLTPEKNYIRSRVAARLGVRLGALDRPLWEGGGYGGRDRDSDWPVLFKRALSIASIELLGEPIEFGKKVPRCVLIRAEEIAGADMSDLERSARKPLRMAAA
jgi:hypothetical protein